MGLLKGSQTLQLVSSGGGGGRVLKRVGVLGLRG